jgi:glycosyltransferase involved in cell wall biosynthesis
MGVENPREPVRSDLTVAHVIDPGVVGGAESVVWALATGRNRFVGRTLVAALTQPGQHPYVDGLRREGVPMIEVETGRRRYLAEARALAKALRDQGVAVVHTHVYHADFVGYWAARSLGLPVVATCHGQTSGNWKNHLYQWTDRRLLRRFDAVVCVSQRSTEQLLRSGCPSRLLHVIPNGYDGHVILDAAGARSRLGLPAEALIVGWVGRFSAEKGPDLFVRAFAKIEVPNTLAVMIGEGPEWERTAMLATELRVENRVRLLGCRADAAKLFAAFDCLAISSRNEGLPMVMWEAVAAGTPVVAFSVGGIPEVLTPDSAWLVQPANTSALGAAIAEAVTYRGEAGQRAERARLIMEECYGLEAWVLKIETLYSLVNRKHVRPLGA